MRDYTRLDAAEFGRLLVESGDLDPVYIPLVKLYRAELDEHAMAQWLTAYWCLYDAGAACWLSEQPRRWFWHHLQVAAENKKEAPTGKPWPRGRERRHWRGSQAIHTVTRLSRRYDSALTFVGCLRGADTAASTIRRVREHYGFGAWIAFKVADMLERVYGDELVFTDAEVFFFDTPAEGARTLAEQKHGDLEHASAWAVGWLHRRLGHLQAPPRYDRTLDLQEYETILCKWKSHLNGHYPLWNDTRELRKALPAWRHVSHVAVRFLELLPSLPKAVSHA